MKRRGLLTAVGAAIAGGAAIGTGAFTSVEADRTVSVAVADEDQALLALEPNDRQFAQQLNREELRLDFDNVAEGDGSGPGTDSIYEFDRVFDAHNQAAQDLFIQASFSDTQDLEAVGFYVEETAGQPIEGDVAVRVRQGHTVTIGVSLDTDGTDAEGVAEEFDATITAGDETDADTILDEDGEEMDDGDNGGPGA